MHGCQRVRDAGCVGRSCKNGTVAANSNDKRHQLCPASAVLAANRDPPKCRLHRLKAWKISCHVAVGAGKPAIAQLVEHLTVELCSYQMVRGSIPGGRICTDLSFGCSAGSNILIFHSPSSEDFWEADVSEKSGSRKSFTRCFPRIRICAF